MATLVFSCKDKNMTPFYDKMFRSLFEEHASWVNLGPGSPELPQLQQFMDECMLAEARFQEHYDYEMVDTHGATTTGKYRRVIHNDDGTPKLLIPTVTIT